MMFMTFRLPQNLSTGPGPEGGLAEFNREILAEKAAALGRTGKAIERALTALAECTDPEARDALVQAAADAVQGLIIQRELTGLRNNRALIADFGVPREVVLRIGVRPKA